MNRDEAKNSNNSNKNNKSISVNRCKYKLKANEAESTQPAVFANCLNTSVEQTIV